MSTVMWEQALQGVAPIVGGQALPPATYRFRVVGGEGKKNSGGGLMLTLQLEVASGPLAGRKAFHNENMPKGNSDSDKQRMGFFLGLLEAFGVTGQQLGQMFAGRAIDVDTIDYLAKSLVQTGRIIKGTARPQASDASRINLGGWTPDDGIEPEPPVQKAVAPAVGGPAFPGGVPGGVPGAPGFPGGAPAGGQGGFAPAGGPGAMPLGGFPGSGQGLQPNAAPDWANQPAAAQPQAAGMNQFTQPAQAQQAPAQQQDQGFPGQQFQGQVNPANFPAQGQQPSAFTQLAQQPGSGFGAPIEQQAGQQFGGPVQGFQGQPDQAGQFQQQGMQAGPAQQLPGAPQAQAFQQFGGQQPNPNGLPTGGFPQGQPPAGAPQASF